MAYNSVAFTGTNGQWQTLHIELNIVSQDIANNKTKFSYKVWAKSNTSGASAYGNGSYTISGAHSDNGGAYWSWNYTTEQLIAQGTFEKTHNSDGSLAQQTLTASASIATAISATVSVSLDVPTIPRASTVSSVTGLVLGSAFSVNIARADSTFTHQVWWKIHPSHGWQNLGSGHGISVSFTPALTLATFYPNSTSGTLQIQLRTFKGSNIVGTDVQQSFTFTIPTSVIPSIGSIGISEKNSTVTTKVGAGLWVQNQSRVDVSLTGVTGIHGSTIKSYKIEIDTNVYNTSSVTNYLLSKNGDIVFKATVTDSRGRSRTISRTISVIPYLPPRILSAQFRRSDNTGVVDGVGVYARVDIYATATTIKNGTTEKNSLTYEILSRPSGVGSYVSKASNTISGLTYHSHNIVSIYDINYSYDFQLKVTDIFGSVIVLGKIATGEITMMWAQKTLAVGKVITRGDRNLQVGSSGIDSEGPITINSVHIVESQSNSNGTWIKYEDGTLICYQYQTVTNQAINSAYGSIFFGTRTWTFPHSFISNPAITSSSRWGTGAGWSSGIPNNTTSALLYFFDAVTRATGTKVLISAIAIGRWK